MVLDTGFYKMKPRSCKVTLVREEWRVPREYEFGDTVVVPLWAGKKMRWRMADGELPASLE